MIVKIIIIIIIMQNLAAKKRLIEYFLFIPKTIQYELCMYIFVSIHEI